MRSEVFSVRAGSASGQFATIFGAECLTVHSSAYRSREAVESIRQRARAQPASAANDVAAPAHRTLAPAAQTTYSYLF